jgi:hypothetical protein
VSRAAKWLAAVSVLFSAHAQAQIAPEPDAAASDSTIVVTGQNEEPPSRKEVFDQAFKLSRMRSGDIYQVAAARFEAPLCPGVNGLRQDAAERVVHRIRANAARIKLAVAKAGCSPNLVVAFVEDGRELLDNLARRRDRPLRLITAAERQELLADEAPVRVWNNIRTISLVFPPGPVRIWRDEEQPPSLARNVVMFLPARKEIMSALVVFDRGAVIGLTLDQLADYATMRGLAHTRPANGDEPMETILSLFADQERRPAALSPFDLGYLQGLYFGPPNDRAVTKMLRVRGRAAWEEAKLFTSGEQVRGP